MLLTSKGVYLMSMSGSLSRSWWMLVMYCGRSCVLGRVHALVGHRHMRKDRVVEASCRPCCKGCAV